MQPTNQVQTNQVLSSLPVQNETTQQYVPTVIPNTIKVPRLVSEIEKDYKSTSFISHLAIQAIAWVSYFVTSNTGLKFGSITLSGVSLISYLVHLVLLKKK